MPRKYSEIELLSDLRRVAGKLGHPPTTTQYGNTVDDGLGSYTATVYTRRFGSWAEALESAGFDETDVEQRTGPEVTCYKCNNTFRTQQTGDTIVCPSCETGIKAERALIRRASDNKQVRDIARGPTVSDGNYNRTSRRIEAKLHPTSGTRNGVPHQTTPVYYLPGDERRAVSAFIEENEAYVRLNLDTDEQNILRMSLSDDMYQLFLEQWEWLGYAATETTNGTDETRTDSSSDEQSSTTTPETEASATHE